MVDMLVDHIVAELLHPVLVFAGRIVLFINEAAPLAHKERIALILYQISP